LRNSIQTVVMVTDWIMKGKPILMKDMKDTW